MVRISPRTEYRERRQALFEAWSTGTDSCAQVGGQFGVSSIRARQIIWKAIVTDGCRSPRARELMEKADSDGYWLRRYDANFQNSDEHQLSILTKAESALRTWMTHAADKWSR